MTSKVKLIALGFLLCTCLTTTSNATIISSYSEGVIDGDYYDGLGLFGALGANLRGLSYKLTVSFERSLNAEIDNAFISYSGSEGTAPTTFSATVNNITFITTAISNVSSQQLVYNGLSTGNNLFEFDAIASSAVGTTIDGYYVNGSNNLYVTSETSAFVGQVRNPGGFYLHTAQGSDDAGAAFGLNLNGTATFFYAKADVIGLNVGESVPEPSTIALLGVSSLALTLTRRRRAKD